MKTIEIDLAPTIGNLRFKKILLCVKETLKHIMKEDESFILFQKPNDLDYISLELKEIISICLKMIICLEGNEEYREICNDLKNNVDNTQYFLKPSKMIRRTLYRDIKEFLFLYSNRQTDTEVKPKERQEILKTTLDLVKTHINTLYSSSEYNKNNRDNEKVYKQYMEFLSRCEERITGSHQKLNSFLQTITSANADYITPFFRIQPPQFREKYIYPIVYDLMYNRFATVLRILTYRKELTSVKYFSKESERLKNEQTHSYDNKFSYMSDLNLLLNNIPDEFDFQNKLSDETNYIQNTQEIVTKTILLHYSKIFDADYTSLVSLLKQIENHTTAHNEPQYRLKKIEKNITINLESNYFRKLSLYIK